MTNKRDRVWADVQTTTTIVSKASAIIPVDGVDLEDHCELVQAVEVAAEASKVLIATDMLCSDPADEHDLPKTTIAISRLYPDNGFDGPDTNSPKEWPLK